MRLSESQRGVLLEAARRAIQYGLEHGAPMLPEVQDHPSLAGGGASFVTLRYRQRLRCCIGSLEATRPLLLDVAANAYAAAFKDPRFPPLQVQETTHLRVGVSVLSAPQRLRFRDQRELLAQLRPGLDGLILDEHGHRGTFLPAVWDQLTEAEEFLAQLKLKAGLSGDYWSDTVKIWRYTTDSFEADQTPSQRG